MCLCGTSILVRRTFLSSFGPIWQYPKDEGKSCKKGKKKNHISFNHFITFKTVNQRPQKMKTEFQDDNVARWKCTFAGWENITV